MSRWASSIIAALCVLTLCGIFVSGWRRIEEYTETRFVRFESWDASFDGEIEVLKLWLNEGWRVKEITGDGCCCLEVTLEKTSWRMK